MVLFLFSITSDSQIKNNRGYFTENDKPYTGEYIEYHENTNVKFTAYIINGYIDGKAKYYYHNGILNEMHHYKNGKYHGVFIKYDINGVIKSDIFYNNGKKDGICILYDNGIKKYEIVYKMNNKVKTVVYNTNGEIIKTEIYK